QILCVALRDVLLLVSHLGVGPYLRFLVVHGLNEVVAGPVLPGAAYLRHAPRAQRESEDQELEDVAALHVSGDELAGDVLGRDLLEHTGRVLSGHGEVAPAAPGVRSEAEAAVRATHLAAVEPPVAVAVDDRELRRDAGLVDERLRQLHARASGDERRGAVHLPRVPVPDEPAR